MLRQPRYKITPIRVLRGVSTALVEDAERRYSLIDNRGGVIVVRSGRSGIIFFIAIGPDASATIYQQGPDYTPTDVVKVMYDDIKGPNAHRAVARVVEAIADYQSQLPKRGERRDPAPQIPPKPRDILGYAERADLVTAFGNAGLLGTMRYPSIEDVLSRSTSILASHGLEWDAAFDLRSFKPNAGQLTAHISRSNPTKPHAPVPITNTTITIHWHRFRTSLVEAILMVGMVTE